MDTGIGVEEDGVEGEEFKLFVLTVVGILTHGVLDFL